MSQAQLLDVTIESSNKTENDNYCNKLVAKDTLTVTTDFGVVEQERTQTFYVFTKDQVTKKEAKLDLNQFDVVAKPFSAVGENGETIEMELKYLYPKRA